MERKTKRLGRPTPNYIILLIFMCVLTGCAVREVRQEGSKNRLMRMQGQIDILNNCMQPVLTRMRTNLIEEVASEAKTDHILSGLYNISLPLIANQQTLLGLWLSREGTTEDFWKNLSKQPDVTKEEIDESLLILFLGRLTQYRAPLLQQLIRLRQAEGLGTLNSISKLNREKWSELVNKSGAELEFDTFYQSVDKEFDDLLYGGCKNE